MSKALEVLLELKDCSDSWCEYYVPIGIHERIDDAIEQLLAQPEKDIGYAQALLEEYDKGFNDARLSLPKREPFAVVANNSVGIDVSHSPQGMPLVWLGKLEHGDKLYRVRTGDE